MMKKHFPLCAFALLFALNSTQHLQAQMQWDENGIPLASFSTTNTSQKAIADGMGGFFIVWEDAPHGDTDIFAQWIDASGTKRWNDGGLTISAASDNQKSPALALDGAGGLFIAWHDELSGNLMGQHLNATGTALGPDGGFTICNAAGIQSDIQLVTDGANGIIAAWKDTRNSSTDIYAQRIDPSRQPLWAIDGVAITTAAGTQSFFVLHADLSGGAYLVWQDSRNGTDDIYAQRIDADGAVQWTADGSPICLAAGRQETPSADVIGSGLVITWTDNRSGGPDIYAQFIQRNGTVDWTADGVSICSADGHQLRGQVLAADSDSFFFAWSDFRDGYDIYAQKTNASGQIQWQTDGLPVTESTGLCYYHEMILDGTGGLWLLWNDNLLDADPLDNGINLYYQHLNSDGDKMLAGNGNPLVNIDGTQDAPIMLSDGSTGFIATWQDARDNATALYMQHINDAVTLSAPASNAMIGGGIETAVNWTLPESDILFNTMSLHLSLNSGGTFSQVIANSVNPQNEHYAWTPEGSGSEQAMIQLRAYNAQGIESARFNGNLFKLDTTPPTAFELIQPASAALTGVTPQFKWRKSTDTQSGPVSYTLYLNGTPLVTEVADTIFITPTPIGSGTHSWYVVATDQAGQTRSSSQTWQFSASEDHDPPAPFTVSSPSHGFWTRESAITFKWNATTDANSGLAGYRLLLDGQSAGETDAYTTQITVSGLESGRHSWQVEAIDSVDNARLSDTRIFSIDAVPPQDFNLTAPGHGSWTHDTTPTLTWESVQDTGIGLSHYNLYIDDILVGNHLPNSATAFTPNAPQALGDGSHTWRVEAVDQLGNLRNSHSAFDLHVDTQAPTPFAPASPDNAAQLATLTPTLSWTPSTDAGAGLRHYQLFIDGEAHGAVTTETTFPLWPAVSEGTHTWHVQAEDLAGNTITTSTRSFTADTTAPAPFTMITPAEGRIFNSLRPEFRWESGKDALTGFDRFEFFLDGQRIGDSRSAEDTVVTLDFDLTNGNHYWKVIAYDAVGNTRISAHVNFGIAAYPPVITSPSVAAGTEDMPFSYTATATDENDEPVTITFESVPSWCTVDGPVISGTPPNGAASTTFEVIAEDALFTVQQSVTLTLTAVDDRPAITAIADRTLPEDGRLTGIEFTMSDEETLPGSLILTTASTDTNVIPLRGIEIVGDGFNRSLNITPKQNQHGQSTVSLTINDGTHEETIHFQITVTPVNDTPFLTPLPAQQIDEDQSRTGIVLTYSDIETAAENLSLSFTAADPDLIAPAGIEFIPGATPKLNLTPLPNANGTTHITVTVTDGEADSTVTFTLTVNPVNDKPVLTSAATIKGTEEEMLSYTATAEDVDGTALTFTFPGLPDWLTADAATIKGAPPEGVTAAQFKVIVSDGSLSDTLALQVEITAVNDAPRFTQALPTVDLGEVDSLKYDIILDNYITDPDHAKTDLIWSINVLGALPVTVGIGGTPKTARVRAADFEGQVRVVFTVRDPLGASASDTLTLSSRTTAVDEALLGRPDQYQLFDNYPNPFNPATTLRFGLPQAGAVKLTIYNLLGQRIEILLDEHRAAGFHEVQWAPDQLPSGIYLFLIESGSWRKVKRMIYTK